MDKTYTTCSHKAARLLAYGVEVTPILPKKVGERVKYEIPTWADTVIRGMKASGVSDFNLWRSIGRCASDENFRAKVLLSLECSDARGALSLGAA